MAEQEALVLILPQKQWFNKNIQTKLPLLEYTQVRAELRLGMPKKGRSGLLLAPIGATFLLKKTCDKMAVASKCRKERVMMSIDSHLGWDQMSCDSGCPQNLHARDWPWHPDHPIPSFQVLSYRHTASCWAGRRGVSGPGSQCEPSWWQLCSTPLPGYLSTSQWIHEPRWKKKERKEKTRHSASFLLFPFYL